MFQIIPCILLPIIILSSDYFLIKDFRSLAPLISAG